MINILGKLDESTAPAGRIDWNGLLKVIRLAIVVGIAAILGYLITALPGIDALPDSTLDEQIISLFLIPLVESARRWAVDYTA